MAARAREIIDLWVEVSLHATDLDERPNADILTAGLVRNCEHMALTEGLSRTDLDKRIVGDIHSFFRRELLESEIEHRASPRSTS
jgi:hypothetical protein